MPFSKINPNDYMTISIRGVTHYSNGELDYQVRGLWPMGSLPRVDRTWRIGNGTRTCTGPFLDVALKLRDSFMRD